MADAQTQESDQTPFRLDPEATADWRRGVDVDIGSIIGPVDDKSIAGLTTGLKSAQVAKVAQDEALTREFDATAARDKAYRERAFQLEGVAANELPRPWNAEEEHKRFETNPIEGFGSVGGLFAVIASAFTKAPMENAINGLAGAINGTREGNEAAYNRAYDAFKTNVHLADQRFKMQHELYEDALSLGTADMAASQAKFHNAAIRFGDRKALMLMENGMYPELYELLDARAKAHEQMIKAADATDLHAIQKAAVDSIKMNPPQTGDPVQDKIQLAAQIQRIYDGGGKYGTAEQEAVGRYVQDNWRKNPQEFTEGLAKVHEQFSRTADLDRQRNDYIAQRWQAWRDAHQGEDPPAEEQARITQEAASLGRGARTAGGAGAGGAALTNARQIQQDAEAHKTQMRSEHPDWTPEQLDKDRDDYVRRREIATRAPTAHDIFVSDVQYDKVERMKDAIGKVEGLLHKHNFTTGIGGTLTRPIEAVANILGSNETDRRQFERDVLEIKEMGQQALFDRSGKPLSSEAADAGKIFAGLKPGDTTVNTLRAYMELRPVLAKLQAQIKARGRGEGPVSGGDAKSPAPRTEEPTAKDQPWLADPVKDGLDKRSDISDSPPVTGARKAPDGNWYVDDPKRPGKYLQVQLG